ncbi:hypothetical protein [Anaerosporobacter sp.]|uniref:hypothetical protein n=1 Tax=Anaerosporobacter sp. TaxID=1872529 RepID=UPI00286F6BFE|nr:hypothetical protein [Anaerosporobacter sp.]
MAQKKGLVLNEFDGHSMMEAFNNAFEIKKEVTANQPLQFVESSRSLVVKQGETERQNLIHEQEKPKEDDTLAMLARLVR